MFKNDIAAADEGFGIKACLKSALLALVLTVLFLIVIAVLLCYTPLPDTWTGAIVSIASYLSVALAGVLCGLRSKTRGYLTGLIGGLVYMLILHVLGAIAFGGINFDGFWLRVLGGALAGALGGVLGVNLRR